MSAKNMIFNVKKTNKNNFYKNKILFKINDISILISKRELYGTKKSFKYCIKLPQMI